MSKARELAVGIGMTGAGIGYLLLTGDIPRRGDVDASFVPRILAWMMIGLGALQLLAARRAEAAGADSPSAAPALTVVGISLALIAAFIALMQPLGFPVAASLFLFAQFWLLTPADRKPRPGLYAALAVTASIVIFIAFRYGFKLLLPGGPLTPYLP